MTLGHAVALFVLAVAGTWLVSPLVLWLAARHQQRKRTARHPGYVPEEALRRVIERQREVAPWQ